MKFYTKETLKSFFRHSKKYKLSGIFIILSVIIVSIVEVIIPLYFKKFFDILAGAQAVNSVTAQLMSIFYVIVFLSFISWLFWRIATFFVVYFQSHIIEDLYNSCFKYLHKHSYSFFQNNFVGSLVKRVNRYVRAFENISDRVAFDIVQLVIGLLIIIGVLLYHKFILGLILSIWLIIYLVINWYVTK